MSHLLRIVLLAATICLGLGVSSCATRRPTAPIVYTRNNIHIIDEVVGGRIESRASYTGWVGPMAGHRMLPVNSPVVVGRYFKHGREYGFMLHRPNGEDIFFEYNLRRMRMPWRTYVNRITSSDKVSLDGFSDIDQEGIKKGEPLIGMTKKGVITALGIPAAHETPDLDNNKWVYWRKRFGRRMLIEFDRNGRVARVR